tara:strand:- start:2200 stop:2427 length:228 start_codon:yes stop_codon:yes gene_type:complete
MGTITVDEVDYDTELLSAEGNDILAHLMQADNALKEAALTMGLMKAATVHLIDDLKTNHLTEEAIATEEVEATEE